MKQHVVSCLCIAILVSCGAPAETVTPADDTTNLQADVPVAVDTVTEVVEGPVSGAGNYSYETFENKTAGGWGYRILWDGNLYIEQPHIPAVQGNKGFKTEADAAKTAEFAISKMDQGFVPPTLTVEELDSLGVIGS